MVTSSIETWADQNPNLSLKFQLKFEMFALDNKLGQDSNVTRAKR